MNIRICVMFFLIAQSLQTQAQQVFKCINPDGRVVFSNVTCADPEGTSEALTLKINKVGSMATQEQINNYNSQQIAPAEISKNKSETQYSTPAKEERKVVRENCNTVGTSTFCRNSEGDKKVTNRIGNTEFIKEVDSEGNVTKTTRINQ